MQLPGRLALTTLGDILAGLHRARATGALELTALSAGGRRHRVYLRRGLVAGVELGFPVPPARLGEVLVGEGLASRVAVARVLEGTSESEGAAPCGERLVRAGVVTAEARDAALRRQIRARLDALFALFDRGTDRAHNGDRGARVAHGAERGEEFRPWARDAPGARCAHGARDAERSRDAEVRFHVGVAAGRPSPDVAVAPLLAREFLHGRRRGRGGGTSAARGDEATPGAVSERVGTETHGARAQPLTHERIRALRVLGLPAGALSDEIRRAFRTAAARLHPDRHRDAPPRERARLHAAFAELSAAYHLLSA